MDLHTFSALSAESECIMRLASLRIATYVRCMGWGGPNSCRSGEFIFSSKNLSQSLHCTKIISQIR